MMFDLISSLCSTDLISDLISELHSTDLISELHSTNLISALHSTDLISSLHCTDLIFALHSTDLIEPDCHCYCTSVNSIYISWELFIALLNLKCTQISSQIINFY